MTDRWTDSLAAQGAHIENQDVLHFGDPAAELRAACEATVVVPLTHLGLLECSGDDAKSFLHNQLTSDINHLGANAAQHSAWCTAKGRMVASFIFYRVGAAYRALLAADLLAATQKRLQMYVLRAKVKITDLGKTHALIGIAGPQATAALNEAGLAVPAEDMQTLSNAQGSTLRLDATRYIAIVERAQVDALWSALSAQARPVGFPVWQWLDIRAGTPLICAATKEAFVPQMADFDRIGGVSFHKGCYPGQEIVARTQYLGKVKRHLYRLQAAVPMTAGTPILSPESPDHAVGMIANAAPAPTGGYSALAVVQESFVAGELTLGLPDGPRFTIEALA